MHLALPSVRDNPVYHVGDNQGRDLKKNEEVLTILRGIWHMEKYIEFNCAFSQRFTILRK